MRMERKQQYIPTYIIHFIGLSTKCESEGIRNPQECEIILHLVAK